jgi:hypothetical protein
MLMTHLFTMMLYLVPVPANLPAIFSDLVTITPDLMTMV